jgi:hypothetical protein
MSTNLQLFLKRSRLSWSSRYLPEVELLKKSPFIITLPKNGKLPLISKKLLMALATECSQSPEQASMLKRMETLTPSN